MNIFDSIAFYFSLSLFLVGFCGGFFGGTLYVWCYNKISDWRLARNLKNGGKKKW